MNNEQKVAHRCWKWLHLGGKTETTWVNHSRVRALGSRQSGGRLVKYLNGGQAAEGLGDPAHDASYSVRDGRRANAFGREL